MKHLLILVLFPFLHAHAQPPLPNAPHKRAECQNFIVITWDGIAREDLFGTNNDFPLTPFLKEHLLKKGLFIGGPGSPSMTISNKPGLSLPGYKSIYTGESPKDETNDGELSPGKPNQNTATTILERVANLPGVEKGEVASIASWEDYALAVEKKAGTVLTNGGQNTLKENSFDGSPHLNPEQKRKFRTKLAKINEKIRKGVSDWQHGHEEKNRADIRYDDETWELSKLYIEAYRPRFLAIGFNDSDEWGHWGKGGSGKSEGMEATLRKYDLWLKELMELLQSDSLKEYGKNTCLLVTTDHGRGIGDLWSEHESKPGREIPEARFVWAYLLTPEMNLELPITKNIAQYEHNHLCPTMEQLMGFEKLSGRGVFITEAFPKRLPSLATDRKLPPAPRHFISPDTVERPQVERD